MFIFNNKRKLYLIDPRFQWRFALLLGLFMLLSNGFFSYIVYGYFVQFLSLVEPSPELDIEHQKQRLVMLLSILLLLYSLLASVMGFFFSHRIAGPMFKLKQFLRGIREGNPRHKLIFRKGDFFPEVADEVNQTLAWLDNHDSASPQGTEGEKGSS